MSLIVVTHGHMAHFQNAAYLVNTLNIPIAMNKKDMLIPDNRKQSLLAKTFLGKIVLSVSLNCFEKDNLEAFEPTSYFVHGKPKRNRKWVKCKGRKGLVQKHWTFLFCYCEWGYMKDNKQIYGNIG